MKRVFFFILPLSIALYSCTMETMPENSVKTFDNFEITIESSNCTDSTKATLYESTKVKWVIGDAIGIYSDQQAPVKYVMTDDGKWRGEPVTGTSFYAYYPYNEGTYDSTNPYRLQMNLNGNLPMVAKGNDNKLMFKQTVGLLHFKIKSSHNMPFATIRENNGETNLYGEGYIKMDDDSPILVLNQGDFNPNRAPMHFRCETQIDTDDRYVHDYYFSIPEQVFENGFEVQFFSVVEKDENGNMLQFTKRTNKACHIQRGVIKSYKMIDVDQESQEIEEDLLVERDALIALYNALDGPNWTNSTNWCSERPIGEWYGISTDDNGIVLYITLPDNNLTGVLPDIFGSLHKLRGIWLPDNTISGSIPESICDLEELSGLVLSGNSLSGPLPDISQMDNMTYLSLSQNSFNGGIPSSYAAFLDKNSWSLNIEDNCLSGLLPEEIASHPLFFKYIGSYLAKQKDGYGIRLNGERLPAVKGIYKTLDGDDFDLGDAYSKSDYTLIVSSSMTSNFKDTGGNLDVARDYLPQGLQVIIAVGDVRYGEDYQEYINFQQLEDFPNRIIRGYYSDYDDVVAPISPTLYSSAVVVNKEGYVVFIVDSAFFIEGLPVSTPMRGLDWFLDTSINDGRIYESSDYSRDGVVHVHQTATEGNGINLVFMGDAFSDRLIQDGSYHSYMKKAIEAFFSKEPFSSFRSLFNVYSVDVVSKNEVYYGDTAIDACSAIIEATTDNKALSYASRAATEEQLSNAVVVVLVKRKHYSPAGRCHLHYSPGDCSLADDYGPGIGVAFCMGDDEIDEQMLPYLVSHEAGGHGFAKLDDEYIVSDGVISDSWRNSLEYDFQYGYWKNVDFTDNPDVVKWSQFIRDSRYAQESIGCYEGGSKYAYGVWRPTEKSIMRCDPDEGFNAPSRYAIWYRINKLAYGPEWQGTYEDFVEFDKPNRTPEAIAKRKAQRRNYVEKDFVPLAPPVVIEGDWREIKEIR